MSAQIANDELSLRFHLFKVFGVYALQRLRLRPVLQGDPVGDMRKLFPALKPVRQHMLDLPRKQPDDCVGIGIGLPFSGREHSDERVLFAPSGQFYQRQRPEIVRFMYMLCARLFGYHPGGIGVEDEITTSGQTSFAIDAAFISSFVQNSKSVTALFTPFP